MAGNGNPDCYAQALGDCRGPVTREHYVSKSILELVNARSGEVSRSVLVRGLRFQPPGALEERGVASLVGKVLCKGHNEILGQRFDPAGLAMFKAMDALNEAATPGQVYRVNGDDLERWMLKTFIGGLFSSNFAVAPGETMKGFSPPPDWLEILFKGAVFPYGSGLYWLAGEVGRVFTADAEVLQFEPIKEQGAEVIRGLRVRFFGFDFALTMGLMLPGGEGPFQNVAYRPAGIREVGGQRIEFVWKAGTESEEIVVLRRPR